MQEAVRSFLGRAGESGKKRMEVLLRGKYNPCKEAVPDNDRLQIDNRSEKQEVL